MHEASLVQGLLEIVLKSVQEHDAANPLNRVKAIRQIICGAGLLACFEEHTLRGCFEIFAEGTLAEGAELVVNVMPLECECLSCGNKFTLLERHFKCPKCGGEEVHFSGGNGLVLQALNVESEDGDND